MAKTKKKKKVARRRRRSVSGINSATVNNTMMSMAGIAAGAFAATAINKIASENFKDAQGQPRLNTKMVAALQVAAGVLLAPKFIPGEMGKSIGQGILAIGTMQLLKEFKVISGIAGIGDTDAIEFGVSGIGDLHLVSGPGGESFDESSGLISGMDDEDFDL